MTRIQTIGLTLALLAATTPALAAPPAGHPSPAQAMDMMLPATPPKASELPHQGKVLSAIDANEYTYLEVSGKGGPLWLAAPLLKVKVGSTVRYEDGAVMSNFYSKLLKRTFAQVMFVNYVMVVAEK